MTKHLSAEERERMKFVTDIKKLSTEELYRKLREFVDRTAEHVQRMAAVACELEQRGEDMSKIRGGIREYLKAVHEHRLHPQAVVKLIGNQTVLGAVSMLPVKTQEKLLERETVAIATGSGVQEKKLHLLTRDEVNRVFDPLNRRVLSPEEQRKPVPRGSINQDRTWPVTFRLNEDEYKALQGFAERSKMSMQALTVQTLRKAKLLKV